MKGQSIFITGGCGYLGRNLIKAWYDNNEIVVYSRDEAKHYLLKKEFPKVKFVIGDVRDIDRMRVASKRCDTGVFAASLKQISACDENPGEAAQTIINGALNSRRIAEENEFYQACFISSDKACAATTIYGAAKFFAEQAFIVNATKLPSLTSCRYGNVMNSTGSIVPLIHHALKNNIELELYSPKMTRFMITIEEAIGLVEKSLNGFSGVTVIPKIKSFYIKDLFEIYQAEFGLKYRISQPRVGEKIHEVIISNEEVPRTFNHGDVFTISPNFTYNSLSTGECSSADFTLEKAELYKFLKDKNFYESKNTNR